MLETIGRYRVEEKLGEGSQGEVFKGYDPSIDRTLAIKVLREERCSDPEYRARFLREARAAGILSHANIATIYDVGEIGERPCPYIVMEYLDGEPLDEVMKSGEKFSIRKIVMIGIQLAKALEYAHAEGIIHRDVKPANIVRLKNGIDVKLTDFGIARLESKEMAHHTAMGQVLGTPQYMSPEQVLGEKVDGRSDLFSLGVVLYQLVTGQKPFDADSLGTLLLQITKETQKPIAAMAPGAPPSLRRIIDRLLDKRPEKRYQTGQEVTDALIKVLKEIDEASEKEALPRIIPLGVKWAIAMAAVVALTMVVSGFVIYKKQYRVIFNRVIADGVSLAKFMAVESAVPVLSEDWVSIEVFIGDVMARDQFAYLQVIDHEGIVRGSSDRSDVGKPLRLPERATVLSQEEGVVVQGHDSGGKPVLSFTVAVVFQGREIGRVRLGIPQAPFKEVTDTTVWMLAVLMAVTIGAVALFTYVLASRLSGPISSVTRALNEVVEGNLSHRIAEQRKDEFGRLFAAFNKMAEALQAQGDKDRDQDGSPAAGRSS